MGSAFFFFFFAKHINSQALPMGGGGNKAELVLGGRGRVGWMNSTCCCRRVKEAGCGESGGHVPGPVMEESTVPYSLLLPTSKTLLIPTLKNTTTIHFKAGEQIGFVHNIICFFVII